jgi:hypothetical protein
MKNPNWMDLVPDSPDAEDDQTLRERANYDERITFPLESLPMEIRALLKKGKDGKQWAVAQVFYRCNRKVWVPAADYSKQNKNWDHLECGLVHSAVSGYDYSHHATGKSNRYKCKACTETWKQSDPGGRFLVIYDGQTVIQIILNEPPQLLHNAFIKDRVKYLRKFEPREEFRDTIPIIPKLKASVRIRATDDGLSNQIWTTVLGDQEDGDHMEALEALAKTALEENRELHEEKNLIDAGHAARVMANKNPLTHQDCVYTSVGDFTLPERDNL